MFKSLCYYEKSGIRRNKCHEYAFVIWVTLAWGGVVVEEFVGALPRIAVGEDRSLFLFIICSFRDTVKSYKMHV